MECGVSDPHSVQLLLTSATTRRRRGGSGDGFTDFMKHIFTDPFTQSTYTARRGDVTDRGLTILHVMFAGLKLLPPAAVLDIGDRPFVYKQFRCTAVPQRMRYVRSTQSESRARAMQLRPEITSCECEQTLIRC